MPEQHRIHENEAIEPAEAIELTVASATIAAGTTVVKDEHDVVAEAQTETETGNTRSNFRTASIMTALFVSIYPLLNG